MLDNLFLEVLNLTITGGFVILGVMVARLLMVKFPKKYSYLLWAIVLVRLLIPISWESNLSLMPTTSQPVFTPEMVYETVPQVDTGVEVLDEVINPMLPPVTQPEASVNPIQIRIFIWRVLWMTGMTAMAVYGLVQYFLLKRRLSTAIPLENRIYLADNIPSPFVLGLIRPKIYLPSHLEEQERGYIIAHEQCHLKRFDHLTRVLAFAVLAIHWFNPLVWVAFVLSERDMERACDEAVLATMEGDIRRDYATSLLRFATRGRVISATPLAFGEGDTKGRVKNVMGYKKPVVWVTLVAIVLAVCVGVGLMSNQTQVIDDYTLPQAIADGAFVRNGDGVMAGREYLDAFEEAAANGEDTSLRSVYQFTPEGAEEPVLAVTEIVYEKELFTVTQYPTTPEETQLVNTYQYLVTETVPPVSSTAKYETCRAHYLVNDPKVTYEDIMNGFLSSQLDAAEDAYVIDVEFLP